MTLGGEFSTGTTPASHECARSSILVTEERYSSRLGRSRVCERDRGVEVSRARVLPFWGANPANPSVRSITSSVDVPTAAGDTDLEGPAVGLGCGRFTSSSSEEMTYTG